MSTLPPSDELRWNALGPADEPEQPGRSNRSRAILVVLWVGALLLFIALLLSSHSTTTSSPESISYSTVLSIPETRDRELDSRG
jgi:hypothetical protein